MRFFLGLRHHAWVTGRTAGFLNDCEHLTVRIECTSLWVSFTKQGAQEDSWVLNDCEHRVGFFLGLRHHAWSRGGQLGFE